VVVYLLRAIEDLFSLVCFLILTSTLIFICAAITFYIKKIVIGNMLYTKLDGFIYSFIMGIIIEVLLSVTSIIILYIFHINNILDNYDTLLVIKKGCNYTIMLSPISSFVGCIIGIKIYSPPWKRLYK
jgi:hypothetical protein